MGLLHSFCSEVLTGLMGAERAEEADKSEALETIDVVVFERERTGIVGVSAGGGTESIMI